MSREQLTEKVVTDHYSQLSSRWNEALTQENFDAAIISAGEENFFFQDDQTRHFGRTPTWSSGHHSHCSPAFCLSSGKNCLLNESTCGLLACSRRNTSEQNKHLKIEVFDTEDYSEGIAGELKSLRLPIGTSPNKNDFAGSANPERLVNRLHFTRASEGMKLSS